MDLLRRKRGIQKSRLTKMEAFVNTALQQQPPPSSSEVSARLALMNDIKDNFNKIQEEIEDNSTSEDLIKELDEREEFESQWCRIKGKLEELLSSIKPEGSHRASTSSSQISSPQVKLPKLNLPTFNGDLLQWTSYYDLFSALVDSNSTLTPVEKLQYLKSSLQGEASKLIQSVLVTAANYQQAWLMLKERYDNNKLIVFAHMRSLFNLPAMSGECHIELRRLLDNAQEQVRALTVLQQPVNHWDTVLVFLIAQKMDQETRKQWELATPSKNIPSFADMKKFMEARCQALEAAKPAEGTSFQSASNVSYTREIGESNAKTSKASSSSLHSTEQVCPLCKSQHPIYKCPVFIKKSPEERLHCVKQASLCINCLKQGHSVYRCQNQSGCKICQRKHSTLLHIPSKFKAQQISNTEKTNAETRTNSDHVTYAVSAQPTQINGSQVLLSTAVIQVFDRSGCAVPARVLLDSGSQVNFITEELAQKLRLPRSQVHIQVSGIGASNNTRPKGKVSIQSQSRISPFSIRMEAIVLKKITNLLPTARVDQSSLNINKHCVLADPMFYRPSKVDMLLGAEIFAQICLKDMTQLQEGGPIAQNTHFGWVLFGNVPAQVSETALTHCVSVTSGCQFDRFWELEDVPDKPHYSTEEECCEKFFQENHYRKPDGRYVVSIPFREDPPQLGDSKRQALRRFYNTEARLDKDVDRKRQYVEFMRDYESLHHMEQISEDELDKSNSYYIPHHEVIREQSTTTKLRVVFDASAKTSNGCSLNSKMMIGPVVQDNIVSILLRFRLHKIPITADIEKMYRQILIHEDQQDYQRIIWRESKQEPLKTFRLSTVTYGTAAAPYLATRTLKQLAKDGKELYPRAATVLENDFYVDDCVSGANTVEEATSLLRELQDLLHSAGFHLRKWASNSSEVLQVVPEEDRETQLPLDMTTSIKTLGIRWHQLQDVFCIRPQLDADTMITKRSILANSSKLYDPMGWLCPVIVNAKILLQDIWKQVTSWDDEVRSDIRVRWMNFAEDVRALSNLRIPRFLNTSADSTDIQLCAFSDASEKAYAAAVYLRVKNGKNQVSCNLIYAKTKVAPIKQISLPRLELCAALLLTRCVQFVTKSIRIPIAAVHAWTDSMIVLSWLAGEPRKWKTFVANRVSEIQSAIDVSNWHHVPSHLNPADLPSRGLSTQELIACDLWWKGPPFLSEPQFEIQNLQSMSKSSITDTSEERRAAIQERIAESGESTSLHCLSSVTASTDDFEEIVGRYSSFFTLIRVIAYIRRFGSRSQRTASKVESSQINRSQLHPAYLSTREVQEARTTCIKVIQERAFSQELSALKEKKSLSIKSPIANLNPFIDDDGVIRVGGRLQRSTIPYSAQHPILLPPSSKFTHLLIQYTHIKYLHAGPALTLSALRQQFWIPQARRKVREVIHRCVTCFRNNPRLSFQQMGDLPKDRVVRTMRPFMTVGIDYAGPVMVKATTGRGRTRTEKAYIALFVCFATKAIHLEAVSDMTSSSFIAALRRFIARRGAPTTVYTDCGTNFVRANKDLSELTSILRAEPVAKEFTAQGINWHFNPPSAPHFGGLWEAVVKSMKHHLKRALGSIAVTFEQLSTTLCQIEACLNSRPICQLSDDPGEYPVLTPNHFLQIHPSNDISQFELANDDRTLPAKWRAIRSIANSFWNRWSLDYLTQLQERKKWKFKEGNLNPDDVVLVKDEDLPPLAWKIARIVHVHPGKDNLVRVATIKTSQGVFKRPISKLCKIPV